MNSKQFFFALNTDDTDEFLDTNKGFYREMWNMVPGNEVTSNPSRQKVKGNTRLTIDFNETEGNICIGACSDNGRNRLIFFIHKPGGVDAIYMWQSGTTGATKIFEWEGLDFSPAYPIEHAFIVDDLLYWVEASNPQRCLNIKRALEGDYVNKEIEINLAKISPILPPVAVRTDDRDGELTFNKVVSNNYQFAYRFKYKDGVYSQPSPYSRTSRGQSDPDITSSFKSIDVTIALPENLNHYVDEIDFLVDENKLSIWRVFGTAKPPDTVTEGQLLTMNFDGQIPLVTLSDQEVKLFEPIPKRSSVQAFIKNRNIINSENNGYSDDDFVYSIYLDGLINSVTSPTTFANLVNNEGFQFHMKSGGSYSAVLIFYDEFHRITTVKKKIPINIPFTVLDGVVQYKPFRHFARIGFSGTPPSYAKYFSIGLSQESNYELYMQIPVTPLFYIAEYDIPENVPVTAFVYNGSVYLKEAPSNFGTSFANLMHLMMPKNIPFTPDSSYKVRTIIGGAGTPLSEPKEENILEVRGNMLVTNEFNINNWNFLNSIGMNQIYVEVYKTKNTVSEEFFEQGRVFPISEFTGTKYIEGDCNYHDPDDSPDDFYVFDNARSESLFSSFPETGYLSDWENIAKLNAEAPSSVVSSISISTAIEATVDKYQRYNSDFERRVEEERTINLGKYKFNFFRGFAYQFFEDPAPWAFYAYKGFNKPPSLSIDYTRPSNNHGRTIVTIDIERELSMPNFIIPSDIYMTDTQINGLHSYSAQDSYVLPYDRGKVVKMVASNDVITIIHEHSLSSMYPGESYVYQGNEQTWMTQDNFLQQDHKLAGGLGSQDPSSVVEYDGRVYGIDRINAEPWRRSTDGVTPLATTYGTKKWFVDKCAKYLGQDVKIIGGYDPYLHIYYITFPAIDTEPAITVGFCEKYNIWVGFYNFIPERYGYVGNSMVTFKNGVPWLHHSNETRGSFYGTTYPARIKVLVNNEYSNDKIFKALGIESNSKWEITSITTPAGQESYIPASKFIKRGDHYVADVLRDQNTPDAIVPAGKPKLLFGREMAGPSIEVTLENSETGEVRIRHLNTRYVKVSGNIMV